MAGAAGARLEFWYDFASTYSYLSAMRIEALAARAGVEVLWKPLLLGPIFRAQGWDNSPFKIYPAKGRYMVRDMERLAAARGLLFKLPWPFPQNSLHAARLALSVSPRDGALPSRAPSTRRSSPTAPTSATNACLRGC
jgi:2-hydroxychromene-2-carboxylate isomerase